MPSQTLYLSYNIVKYNIIYYEIIDNNDPNKVHGNCDVRLYKSEKEGNSLESH